MRYLIKYTKEGNLKFLAHLDLMRSIQRIIRRTDIPVSFSKGFNPHILLSIAQPLSVGMASEGDYLDLVLEEAVDEKDLIEKLNEVTCKGIRFLEATPVEEAEKKQPQGMALIDAAKYNIKITCDDPEKTLKEIEEQLQKTSWNIVKKSKKGPKEVEIRNLIKDIKYWVKDDKVIINALLACGSRENLSANLMVKYLREHCSSLEVDAFTPIKREEMYAFKNKKLVPLYQYFK